VLQVFLEPSCKHLASPQPWSSPRQQRLVGHHGSLRGPTGRPMVGPSAAAGALAPGDSWEPPPRDRGGRAVEQGWWIYWLEIT
jgi:hypothetical protein